MSDIEVVIKLPEEAYTRIQGLVSVDYFEHDICGFSMRRIANGTPLPKGHGRLIDADDLQKEIQKEYADLSGYMATSDEAYMTTEYLIEHRPTIIEADKEEEK